MVVETERELLVRGGHVVAQHYVDNPPRPLAAAGAILRAPWNGAAARRVRDAARSFRPDVVHVHNTWYSLSPAVIHSLAEDGWAVVVTLHNYRTVCANALLLRDGAACTLCVGSHPWHAVRYRCYRDSSALSLLAALTIETPRRLGLWDRCVASFVVLDEAAVPALVAGGIPPDRVVVRSNFAADPGPRPNNPSQSDTVLYVGRLSPEKGADVLLRAWREGAPAGLRLSVFGDGPLRPEFERGAVPGITVGGQLDHAAVLATMLRARAVVVPSICREMAPLTVIEAVGAGLPIVISDAIAMSSLIEESGAGRKVRSSDHGALRDSLLELIDASALDRAGHAGRQLYEERFSEASSLAELEVIYDAATLHTRDRSVNTP